MAITSTEQTAILKTVSALFNKAFTPEITEKFFNFYEENGRDIAAFADGLIGSSSYETFYSEAGTIAEYGAILMAKYGLTYGGSSDADTKMSAFVDYSFANSADDNKLRTIQAVDKYIVASLIPSIETGNVFETMNTAVTNKATVAIDFIGDTANAGKELALDSVTDDAATATVAAAKAAAEAAEAAEEAAEEAASIDGETFELTTGTDDVFNGTVKNDLFDASAADTLQTGDILLDSTSTDADILNALVSTNDVKARIQNVETLNIDGKYVDTGLDLTDVTGAKTLNLNTSYSNGTAEVTAASTLAVETIKAGANIKTLDITAAGFGTRDTLTVDANNAEEVTLSVAAAGTTAINKFDVTTTGNVSIDTIAANSAVTLNLSDATTTITGDGALGSLVVNQTAVNSVITLGGLVTDGAEATGKVKTTINSDQDVTVKAENAKITDTAIESTGTGTLTVQITNDAADIDLADVEADVIDFASASASADTDVALIVNASAKVKLSADIVDTTSDIVTITQANATDAAAALGAGKGTLSLEVAKSQTGIDLIGTTTKTVLLNAGVDAAAAAGDVITMADLRLGANTNTLLIDGSEALTLSKLTLDSTTKDFVSAAEMTGNLTISAVVGDHATVDATIVLGQGDDSLTTAAARKFTVEGTSGTNTIDISSALLGSKVTGGTGDDTIIGNTFGSTLNGGAGDDLITTGGTTTTTVDAGADNDTVIIGGSVADSITLGAGSDKIVIDSSNSGSIVKDFVTGTDTVILTGAGTDINLSSLATAPTTAGVYKFDTTTNFNTTLENNGVALTTKDVADSVQLGYTKTDGTMVAYSLAANATVVAGDKDDVISIATQKIGTITTGTGNDTIILAAGSAGTDSEAIISDFTVGSDKVIITGTALAATTNLTAISPNAGEYAIDNDTTITLSNGGTAFTATDLTTMVQLGYEGAEFTALAGGSTITGGIFDDFLEGAAGNDTFNFIDNGGMDTITAFTHGADTLSFDAMTGITDTTGAVVGTAGVTAGDGKVYVMSDNTVINSDTIDYSKIGTTVDGAVVKVTDADIMTDVAAYITNALDREAAGDNYVVVVNDVTGGASEAYAYSVEVNAEGTITADDITLIGTITANATIDAGDIG